MTQIAIKNIKRGGKTMKINTKYDIGQRVWIIYENRGEVCVFDDIISEICISESGLEYWVQISGDSILEENIILYEEYDKLKDRILKLMEDIHNSEREVKKNGLS